MKTLLLLTLITPLFSQTVKDREGSILSDREKMTTQDRWIYNDTDKAFAAAKASGKPVLAVLRCVPCLGCSGLDAALNDEPHLAPLLDQFVCLRLINVNSLDLTRFQFDYDLSLSALILNADGTTYGRFGSWHHQKNPEDKSTDGLTATLQASLDLHKNYPANKATLANKQPLPLPYKTPLQIPHIANNPKSFAPDLDWQGKVVQSCVHCHQIGDGLKAAFHDKKEPVPLLLSHPTPAPATIGFELSHNHRATITSVQPDSLAAKAGLRARDEILTANGAPVISPADFSWALHNLKNTTLNLLIKRANKTSPINLNLPKDWRLGTDISRRVGTWPMRAWIGGGMKLRDLTDQERHEKNLTTDQLALLAEHVGQYGDHAAAKRNGFRKGDILLQIDHLDTRLTESKLFALLLQKHPKPTALKATILRNDKKLTLTFPLQ
ncbi:MAG: Trx7/PDZ domain-containing (seleno)protein [Akkermansiaceae bacterium]